MSVFDWVQIVLYVVILIALAKPLGLSWRVFLTGNVIS